MEKDIRQHIDDGSIIVFIDGDCGLCSLSALFILRHDLKAQIHIAALQSELGREACRLAGQNPDDLNTVLFLEKGLFYSQSTAMLRVAIGHFSLPFRILARICSMIPLFIRDRIYNLVVKNRHRFFGNKKCEIPPDHLGKFFLSGK